MSYSPRIIQIAAGPDGALYALDNAGTVYGFDKPFESKPGKWLALPALPAPDPSPIPRYRGDIVLGQSFSVPLASGGVDEATVVVINEPQPGHNTERILHLERRGTRSRISLSESHFREWVLDR